MIQFIPFLIAVSSLSVGGIQSQGDRQQSRPRVSSKRIKLNPGSRGYSIKLSANGDTLVSGGFEEPIRLWDLTTAELVTIKEADRNRYALFDFSPDGRIFASGGEHGFTSLWNVASGKRLKRLRCDSWITSISFSPDGKKLACGTADNTVQVWEVGTGKKLQSLKGQEGWIRSVAFSPDGKMLASGSGRPIPEMLFDFRKDFSIVIWNLATGEQQTRVEGHEGSVDFVLFSPNGKSLASSGGMTVQLWDLIAEEKILGRPGYGSLAFSQDGKVIAFHDTPASVAVWELASGKQIAGIPDDSGRDFAFSDFNTLVSARNNAVLFWDLRSIDCGNRTNGGTSSREQLAGC